MKDTETVPDVVAEMRDRVESSLVVSDDMHALALWADRITAAHQREMAEVQAELDRRTSEMIVTGGSAFACSPAVKELFDMVMADKKTAEAELARLRVDAEMAQRWHADEIGQAASQITETRARSESAETLLRRIRDDRSWRTNDNNLWQDICAAIDALAKAGAGP